MPRRSIHDKGGYTMEDLLALSGSPIKSRRMRKTKKVTRKSPARKSVTRKSVTRKRVTRKSVSRKSPARRSVTRKSVKKSRAPYKMSKKDSPSKTHPGRKDYTTKKGDKVFHERGHYVRKSRTPYNRSAIRLMYKVGRGSSYDPFPEFINQIRDNYPQWNVSIEYDPYRVYFEYVDSMGTRQAMNNVLRLAVERGFRIVPIIRFLNENDMPYVRIGIVNPQSAMINDQRRRTLEGVSEVPSFVLRD